ncbi:MAG TPA: hydrogenase maturation protease [Bryobacteraceae bacterium]|jgi:hydrogenase maturation protease
MTDARRRILIACIGNIFLGDDGFGTEVARRMVLRAPLPEGVILRDFGIRSFDLTYALLEPWDLVILVDACSRGAAPGTLYVIEPEMPAAEDTRLDAHSMSPASVLSAVRAQGGAPGKILLVGCEPADIGTDEEGKLGLSDPVMAAVDEAIAMIEHLVAENVPQFQ